MDNELLNRLYLTYQKELYLYLYSLSGDAALAEDLLQEAFLKALLSLSGHHTNMRAWLYMVARNLYFNHRRKEKRKAPLELLNETAGDKEQAVLDRVIAGENNKLLYLALNRLDARKKEVLQLQYFAGLRQKEIAAVLHITPEHVRVLACRAKRELKIYLEGQGYDVP